MSESTIHGGAFLPVTAQNPQSVCCESALLASALQSVGVREHPAFPFAIKCEGDETAWCWLFESASKCGTYETTKLVAWWNDPVWLEKNPQHEWAIIHRILHNMAAEARRIRETVPRIVLRRGRSSAEIPANATPEYRAHTIAQLEGRIAMTAEFTGTKFK